MTVTSKKFPEDSALRDVAGDLGRVTRHSVDVKSLRDGPAGYEANFVALGGLLAAHISASNLFMSARPLQGVGDYAQIYCQLAGGRHIEQAGRTAIICAGAGGMHAGNAQVEVRTPAEKCLGLLVPRQEIREFIRSEDDLVCRSLNERRTELGLLGNYLRSLLDGDVLLDGLTETVVAQQLVQLAALAIDGNGRGRDAAEDETLPAARLIAAKRFVDRNLVDPALDLEKIAGNLGISVSYVKKLFERGGSSPARYIRERRLDRAAKLLTASEGRKKIIDIALSCGWSDISSFNRAFRRHFDVAPSEMQDEANAAMRLRKNGDR
ncbi:AraC family transcriptional regulator [Bradyrhizobium sp. BR13661]|uniref:AraC family transcriptional regulator n=2 Tax=Pseudomonadota TaxID=1224 RepID=UPI002476DF7C|nr:AraC family transcriptional regulator [Bradyrhizobium sp. BR13661]